MAQTFRLARHSVFRACAEIADDGFEDRPDLRKQLPKVWGRWMHSGSLIFAVVEDDELPPSNYVAFAATVFLAENFGQEALSKPIPHLAIRVVEQDLASQSPVLSLDKIRQANANNTLDLYIIHYTEKFPDRYPDDAKRRTRTLMTRGLLNTHIGFGLRSIIHEFCGEEVVAYSEASGMRCRTDYTEFYRENNLPLPPPSKRPYLAGLTREEAALNFGHTMAHLFAPPSPEFDFSPEQQDILWIALFENDDTGWIAKRLAMTTASVKFLLADIYSKVEEKKPLLFASISTEANREVDHKQSQRGPEKRRIVLHYLREHVEELHPRSPKSTSHRRRSEKNAHALSNR